MSIDTLTRKHFLHIVNQPFQLQAGSLPPIWMKLAAVREQTSTSTENHSISNTSNSFSLIFHGPLRPLLPQHDYRVNHPTLGQLDIHLTPMGPAGSGISYEATLTQ